MFAIARNKAGEIFFQIVFFPPQIISLVFNWRIVLLALFDYTVQCIGLRIRLNYSRLLKASLYE